MLGDVLQLGGGGNNHYTSATSEVVSAMMQAKTHQYAVTKEASGNFHTVVQVGGFAVYTFVSAMISHCC